jgi:integrase
MPKRIATDYPGVFYREVVKSGIKGIDRVYYVVFKKNGKLIEAKAGSQLRDDMTPARASNYRGDLIRGKDETPVERRTREKAEKLAAAGKWTIAKLWDAYLEDHPNLKGRVTDENRFNLHIKPILGDREPSSLEPRETDALRENLLKTKKPGTVHNTLELLRRILNYAEEKRLCQVPGFKIEMPEVDNLKTEDLTEEQAGRLWEILQTGIIEKDGDRHLLSPDVTAMMKLAILTGMRRGEIFRLRWENIDLQRGFIAIKNPKGGQDQVVPLSDAVRELLGKHPKTKGSPYLFPARRGKGDKGPQHRSDAGKQFRAIRDAVGLPKDFRPMHGLRHFFASSLASSGQVDLYTLQRLLTHKSPTMTMRYAHLRDESLRRASNLAGDIFSKIGERTDEEKNPTS